MKINLKAFAILALLSPAAVPLHAQAAAGEQLLSRFGINPTVAADGHNGFVLGWQDLDVPHSYGIFAATLPEGALASRKPFRVNTATAGSQIVPAVAADADGRFVFVWQDEARLVGQVFGAGGGGLSPEIPLSPGLVEQIPPRVAMADGGSFLAAWSESRLPKNVLKAALFSAGGVRQGAGIILKARGDQNNLLGVASFPGGFAVGWNEFYECHLDSTGGGVGAVALFDSAGTEGPP